MRISIKTKKSKTNNQKKQKNVWEKARTKTIENRYKNNKKISLKSQTRLKMVLNQDQQ